MTLRSAESSDGTIDGTRPRWGAAAATEPSEGERLERAMRELRHAGWYWGNMSVAEAKERLQDASEGTFLVRESSHSEYLLTISVKTSAGPTNLRIEFQDGKFRLDSVICVRSRLRQFDSVVHLIEHYVLMCKDRRTVSEMPSNGTVHLYLNKPLYHSPPSLQHHCRVTINRHTNQIQELPLPTRLKEFLKEYQYQDPTRGSHHTILVALQMLQHYTSGCNPLEMQPSPHIQSTMKGVCVFLLLHVNVFLILSLRYHCITSLKNIFLP